MNEGLGPSLLWDGRKSTHIRQNTFVFAMIGPLRVRAFADRFVERHTASAKRFVCIAGIAGQPL